MCSLGDAYCIVSIRVGVIHGSLCSVIAIAYVLNKISSSVLNVGKQYTIDNQGPLSVTRTLRQPNSKS